MHFAFTDQQLEFRDAVRQVLARECTPDHVRAAYAAPTARSARWSTLADLGVVGLAVPEAHGGLGLGLVDLVPLAEEAGRVALPEPLVATTGLAAPLLADLDGRRPRRRPHRARGSTPSPPGTWPPPWPIPGGRRGPSPAPTAPTCSCWWPTGPRGSSCTASRGRPVTVTPVPSLDPTRRLGTPVWAPVAGHAARVGGPGRRPPRRHRRPGGRGHRCRAPRVWPTP